PCQAAAVRPAAPAYPAPVPCPTQTAHLIARARPAAATRPAAAARQVAAACQLAIRPAVPWGHPRQDRWVRRRAGQAPTPAPCAFLLAQRARAAHYAFLTVARHRRQRPRRMNHVVLPVRTAARRTHSRIRPALGTRRLPRAGQAFAQAAT